MFFVCYLLQVLSSYLIQVTCPKRKKDTDCGENWTPDSSTTVLFSNHYSIGASCPTLLFKGPIKKCVSCFMFRISWPNCQSCVLQVSVQEIFMLPVTGFQRCLLLLLQPWVFRATGFKLSRATCFMFHAPKEKKTLAVGRIEPRIPAPQVSSLTTTPSVLAFQHCFSRVL